jgi:hypothetical protein
VNDYKGEYIYINGTGFKNGRFTWITSTDISKQGCFKYIDFPIKYEQKKIDAQFVPKT